MGGKVRQPGYSKERRYSGGRVRWTAMFLVEEPDVYLSAGTYDTKAEADIAWQEKLSQMRRGLLSDPRKCRMPFTDFCDVSLDLMTHQKAYTRKTLRGLIDSEFRPYFGRMILVEILPENVARYVQSLRARGLAASTIRSYKAALSGLLSMAVDLGYIAFNPALKIKTPKEKPRRIKAASPGDIGMVMNLLPGPASYMLVNLAIESGGRWGELTESRGQDFQEHPDDPSRDYWDVQRTVSDVGTDNPLKNGSRFYVEDTTKNGQDRQIGLSAPLSAMIREFKRTYNVGPNDLMFPLSRLKPEWEAAWGVPESSSDEPALVIIPEDLGRTEPNAKGRTYAHGTMSGYTAGRCKCDWCKKAYAAYRAERRANGTDLHTKAEQSGRIKSRNLTDHCSGDAFRRNVWNKVLDMANLSRRIRFHDLRHTHATWLARSESISIQELKERMGHKSLETTQRYIDEADIIETRSADVIAGLLAGGQLPKRNLRVV